MYVNPCYDFYVQNFEQNSCVHKTIGLCTLITSKTVYSKIFLPR